MRLTKFTIIFIFLLAFVISVSAQNISFPNEVEGFKFYGFEKLKGIELAKSKKADWQQMLGKDCLSTCELDKDWEITFLTIEGKGEELFSIYSNNDVKEYCKNDVKKTFKVFQQYENTLWEIVLRPKGKISFAKIAFSDKFQEFGIALSDSPYVYDGFEDSNGLEYRIHSKNSKDGKYQKGDLDSIYYKILVTEDSKFHYLFKQEISESMFRIIV